MKAFSKQKLVLHGFACWGYGSHFYVWLVGLSSMFARIQTSFWSDLHVLEGSWNRLIEVKPAIYVICECIDLLRPIRGLTFIVFQYSNSIWMLKYVEDFSLLLVGLLNLFQSLVKVLSIKIRQLFFSIYGILVMHLKWTVLRILLVYKHSDFEHSNSRYSTSDLCSIL